MNKTILLKKITDYLIKKIDRSHLFKWALEMHRVLLAEYKIMEIDCLLISDFIFEMCINPENPEALDDNDLENIVNILEGKSVFKKNVYIKIPKEYKKKSIENLQTILCKFKETGFISKSNQNTIHALYERNGNRTLKTIPEIIYNNILNQLFILPVNKALDISCNMLFIDETEPPKVFMIIDRINRLINIYEGNKIFSCDIYFDERGAFFSIIL